MEITLKALTPLWTGGVDRKSDQTHETGVIGSLRWWYEALVRGLDGSACDPAEKDERCTYRPDAKNQNKICVACQLFGCTGWARKFRFEVRDEGGRVVRKPIQNGQVVFRFVPLKPLHPEEITLLWRTIQLIASYGAIGGKTVLKPSEDASKNTKWYHRDYGLIELVSSVPEELRNRQALEAYLMNDFRECSNQEWPNLRWFWFVQGKTLTRLQHNAIVKRDAKGRYKAEASNLHKWLGGKQQVSKKIFAFHTSGAQRTWGYARSEEELDKVIRMVISKTGWAENDFKRGSEVLDELLGTSL